MRTHLPPPALAALALAGLVACADPPKEAAEDSAAPAIDADGDGFVEDEDCDDADPLSFPGAPERCDAADNDCDRAIDEDAVDKATYYSDFDGDGYGDPDRGQAACDQPAGMVRNGDDCDDAAYEVRPHAVERCDEVDRDCDGLSAPEGWAATLRRADGSVAVLTEADSPWVVGEAEALELCAGSFDATVQLNGGRVSGLDSDRSALRPAVGPAILIGSAISSTVITDLAVEGARAAQGAAVLGPLEGARTVSLVRLRLEGNLASEAGGAVAMAGTVNLSDSLIIDNLAGGAGPSCRGGGLWVDGDLTMVGSALQGNAAACGGAGGPAEAAGGGAWVSGQLIIEDSALDDNRAELTGTASEGLARGGGAWAGGIELRAGALLRDNSAALNMACAAALPVCAGWAEGGAAWTPGDLLATDAILTGNSATRAVDAAGVGLVDGAAVGGALYSAGADLHLLCDRLRPCGVTANTAEAGSGLWWEAATGRLRSDDHDWDAPGAVEAIDGAHARSPGANASFTCTAGAACTEG